MPIDPAIRERYEALLHAAVPPIRMKAMFGGIGVYRDDLFFAILATTARGEVPKLYFKVGDLNRADYESAGMEPFVPFEDDPRPMGYWEVPPAVLAEPEELKVWAEKALAEADQAKRGKR
jgi:DNA transformation protein